MFVETLHASLAQSASGLMILDEGAYRAGASPSESTRLATGATSLRRIVLSRVDKLALGRIRVLAGGIVSVLAGAGEGAGTSKGREVVSSRVQISTLVAESSTAGGLHSRSLRLALLRCFQAKIKLLLALLRRRPSTDKRFFKRGSYNLLVEEVGIIHPLAIVLQHGVVHQAIYTKAKSALRAQFISIYRSNCVRLQEV